MSVRARGRGEVAYTPSADVVDRATKIQERLGAMSVPFAASEIPQGLLRVPERQSLEVRQRRLGGTETAASVLDARSFDVLNRMTVMKTQHLKHELGRHFEFVGANADAVRTPSGRWYFRVTDPRGQKMDVIFGGGLCSGARFMMHAHVGRKGYSDELSPEATLELARLVSTARLRPAPKKEEDEFEVQLDDDEQLPEDAEGLAKEEYRNEDLRDAKAYLKHLVERVPARLPSLLREVARKEPEDYVEADLDRLLGMIADQPIMLRAFDVDSYDGNSLRLSRTDSEGNVALIELMIQEYEDRDPGALLRVAMPPEAPPQRDYQPDLENDLKIIDDIDDDLLTPYFEVTNSSLGVALLRFAADHADPPIAVEDKDTLVGYLDFAKRPAPEPDPEEVDDEVPVAKHTQPLDKQEIRKLRRALGWLDANWEEYHQGNMRNGPQFGYLAYTADNCRVPKLAECYRVVESDQRFKQMLMAHHRTYMTRDCVQAVLEELKAMG